MHGVNQYPILQWVKSLCVDYRGVCMYYEGLCLSLYSYSCHSVSHAVVTDLSREITLGNNPQAACRHYSA